MTPIQIVTAVAVATLIAASFSSTADAGTKGKPSKVNLSKLEACMLAPDGDTDAWQTTRGAACCSISLGYCVVCPHDVSKPCVVGRSGGRDLFSRLKSVAPVTDKLAPVVTMTAPERASFEQGPQLR